MAVDESIVHLTRPGHEDEAAALRRVLAKDSQPAPAHLGPFSTERFGGRQGNDFSGSMSPDLIRRAVEEVRACRTASRSLSRRTTRGCCPAIAPISHKVR